MYLITALKILSHDTRFKIIRMLGTHGQQSTGAFLSATTDDRRIVNRQLTILENEGLIHSVLDKEGRRIYSLNSTAAHEIHTAVANFLGIKIGLSTHPGKPTISKACQDAADIEAETPITVGKRHKTLNEAKRARDLGLSLKTIANNGPKSA